MVKCPKVISVAVKTLVVISTPVYVPTTLLCFAAAKTVCKYYPHSMRARNLKHATANVASFPLVIMSDILLPENPF